MIMFKPPEYEELTDKEINVLYNKLLKEWDEFLLSENIQMTKNKDYYVHKRNLFEVIRRSDKRRVYMEMFLKLKSPDEYKTVANEVFWINVLKPFMVVKKSSPIYNSPNETFCLYKILATIRGVYEKENKEEEFVYPTAQRIQDIIYDLKYCSFNREAIVAFIETLADNYGVGISYIFEKKEKDKRKKK